MFKAFFTQNSSSIFLYFLLFFESLVIYVLTNHFVIIKIKDHIFTGIKIKSKIHKHRKEVDKNKAINQFYINKHR
jgi:hypothetical protein